MRAIPGSAIQINEPWLAYATIDRALLDAAWQLGAWDLERLERRACNEIGAPSAEALNCRQAFADYTEGCTARVRLVDEAPDRQELMQLGAARGYLRWTFRPMKGGLWRESATGDDTLGESGSRQLPCPVAVCSLKNGMRSRSVHRLGQVERNILP